MTREAARLIKELTDTDVADGVRIHAGRRFARGQVQVELAPVPGVEDTVLEADGARLYVETETLKTLDGKVLDAQVEDGEPRFTICEPAEDAVV